MQKVIWIDTETTGLDKNIHGLREVAFLIEIDRQIVEEGLLYIDTMTYRNEKDISKYVRENMDVSEEVLALNPTSSNLLMAFDAVLRKYVNNESKSKFQMAGFNVEFDYGFIEEWFKDVLLSTTDFNKYFSYQKIDVLSLVRHLKYLNLFETKNNQLETLCDYFDVEIDAHKALSDIQATKILNEVLVDEFIVIGKNK